METGSFLECKHFSQDMLQILAGVSKNGEIVDFWWGEILGLENLYHVFVTDSSFIIFLLKVSKK